MRLLGIVASSLLAACSFSGPGDKPIDAPPVGSDGPGSDAHVDFDGPPAPTIREKLITIHGNKISGTQTDFPVWISLTDDDIKARAQADGSDIFFTDEAGTPLDYEIQSWAAPELRAWVRMPTLTSGTDAKLFVVYGDKTKAQPQSSVGVFKNGFAAVWHLDDAFAAAQVVDATGNNNGVASGLAAGNRGIGQLGSGLVLDGTGTGKIAIANPLTGHVDHTITAWVSQNAVTHTSAIVQLGNATTEKARYLYGQYGGTGNDAGFGYISDEFTNTQVLVGQGLKMIAWKYHHDDQGNDVNDFYVDGVELSNYPRNAQGTPNTMGATGNLGYADEPDFGLLNGFSGTLDEIRIATVARADSWIATEFTNQKDPTHFYAVGDEQPVP